MILAFYSVYLLLYMLVKSFIDYRPRHRQLQISKVSEVRRRAIVQELEEEAVLLFHVLPGCCFLFCGLLFSLSCSWVSARTLGRSRRGMWFGV